MAREKGISGTIKQCLCCNKSVFMPTYRIERGGGKYCSLRCTYLYKSKVRKQKFDELKIK